MEIYIYGDIYIYIYIYTYINSFLYQAHIHDLKVKSKINSYVKCFVPVISTSQYLFKEIESLNSNAPDIY